MTQKICIAKDVKWEVLACGVKFKKYKIWFNYFIIQTILCLFLKFFGSKTKMIFEYLNKV